ECAATQFALRQAVQFSVEDGEQLLARACIALFRRLDELFEPLLQHAANSCAARSPCGPEWRNRPPLTIRAARWIYVAASVSSFRREIRLGISRRWNQSHPGASAVAPVSPLARRFRSLA